MNTLLLLHDGPKEMTTLMEYLDTTRQALLPQMKILNEKHLIRRTDDSYQLTTLGRLIVDRMLPLTKIATILDCEWDYLGTHYLDFIPQDLLKRLDELGSCYINETPFAQLFNVNEEIVRLAKEHKFYYSITSFVYPNFMEIYSELISEGVDISIIISKNLFQKLTQDNYQDFETLIGNSNVKIYLYPDSFEFISFTLVNHTFQLRLLTQEGNYDSKEIVFAQGNAHRWGEAFFEHYKAKSECIKEI